MAEDMKDNLMMHDPTSHRMAVEQYGMRPDQNDMHMQMHRPDMVGNNGMRPGEQPIHYHNNHSILDQHVMRTDRDVHQQGMVEPADMRIGVEGPHYRDPSRNDAGDGIQPEVVLTELQVPSRHRRLTEESPAFAVVGDESFPGENGMDTSHQSDQSGQDDESVPVCTTEKSKNGCRTREKANVCLFCGKSRTKVFRHIVQMHNNELRYRAYERMSPSEQAVEKRRMILEGNHRHNMRVLERKTGKLIPARCPSSGVVGDAPISTDDYSSCPQCFAWLRNKEARRHKCPGKSSVGKIEVGRGVGYSVIPSVMEFIKAELAESKGDVKPDIKAMDDDSESQNQLNEEDLPVYDDISEIPVHRSVRAKSGNRPKEKMNVCVFCGKFRTKLFRHIKQVHNNEDRFLEYMKMTPSERKLEKKRMILEGNHRHNIMCLKSKSGQLIPTRCPSKAGTLSVSTDDYTSCPHCLSWLRKTEFGKHKCTSGIKTKKSLKLSKQFTFEQISDESEAVKSILGGMGKDRTFRLISGDNLVMHWLRNETECAQMDNPNWMKSTRERLRYVGDFMMVYRERFNVSDMFEILKLENKEKIIECCRLTRPKNEKAPMKIKPMIVQLIQTLVADFDTSHWSGEDSQVVDEQCYELIKVLHAEFSTGDKKKADSDETDGQQTADDGQEEASSDITGIAKIEAVGDEQQHQPQPQQQHHQGYGMHGGEQLPEPHQPMPHMEDQHQQQLMDSSVQDDLMATYAMSPVGQ